MIAEASSTIIMPYKKIFIEILTVLVSEIILCFLLFLQSLKLKDPKVKRTIFDFFLALKSVCTSKIITFITGTINFANYIELEDFLSMFNLGKANKALGLVCLITFLRKNSPMEEAW